MPPDTEPGLAAGGLAEGEARSGEMEALDENAVRARLAQMGSLYITRPITHDYVRTREQLTSMVYAVFRMYQDRQIKISVNPPYPLRDVARAHMDLESRKTTGKLILTIGD